MEFLSKFADCVDEMPGNVHGVRKKSLTAITRDSLVQTIRGLVQLLTLLKDSARKIFTNREFSEWSPSGE